MNASVCVTGVLIRTYLHLKKALLCPRAQVNGCQLREHRNVTILVTSAGDVATTNASVAVVEAIASVGKCQHAVTGLMMIYSRDCQR